MISLFSGIPRTLIYLQHLSGGTINQDKASERLKTQTNEQKKRTISPHKQKRTQKKTTLPRKQKWEISDNFQKQIYVWPRGQIPQMLIQ